MKALRACVALAGLALTVSSPVSATYRAPAELTKSLERNAVSPEESRRPTSLGAYLPHDAAPTVGDVVAAWKQAGAAFASDIGAQVRVTSDDPPAPLLAYAFVGADYDGDRLNDVSVVRVGFGDDGIDFELEARRGTDGRGLFRMTPEKHEVSCPLPCQLTYSSTTIWSGVPVGSGRAGVLVIQEAVGVVSLPGVEQAFLEVFVTAYDGKGRQLFETSQRGRVTSLPVGVLLDALPIARDAGDIEPGAAIDVLLTVDDGVIVGPLQRTSLQLMSVSGVDGSVRQIGQTFDDSATAAEYTVLSPEGSEPDRIVVADPVDQQQIRWNVSVLDPSSGGEIWRAELGGNIVLSIGDVTGDRRSDIRVLLFSLLSDSADGPKAVYSNTMEIADGSTGRRLRELPVTGTWLMLVDGDRLLDVVTLDNDRTSGGHVLTADARTFSGRRIYHRSHRVSSPPGDVRQSTVGAGDVDADGTDDLAFLYLREHRTTVRTDDSVSTTIRMSVEGGVLISGRTGGVLSGPVTGWPVSAALDGRGDDVVRVAPGGTGQELTAMSGTGGRRLWSVATGATSADVEAGRLDADRCADVVVVSQVPSGRRLTVLDGADGSVRWTALLHGTAPTLRATTPRRECPRR